MDDAAIYQASARNSKGIVSCSGVLEVGTMNEYKIHQRFFAKLKQKAELKRRELEHSYCQEKKNILQEHLISSQNNVTMTDGLVNNPSSVQVGEDNEAKEGELVEKDPETLNEEWNNLSVKVHRYQMKSGRSQENDIQHISSDVGQKNVSQQLIYGFEKAEIGGTTPSTKEKVNRNNITISNGFDEAFTTQSSQGTGEEKDAHEGMSLAKILEESLQLKFSEEHQKTKLQSQMITSTKAITIKEKEREEVDTEGENMKAERRHQEWEGEEEKSLKKEEENVRQLELEYQAVAASEANTLVYTEPEYQHKSALSSVFHSLKDIFFGKCKKSPEIGESTKKVSDINDKKEILSVSTEAHFQCPQIQPQRHDITSDVCGTIPDQLVPVEIDQQNQIETFHANTPFFQKTLSLHIKTQMDNLTLDNHVHGCTTNYIKDISQASKTHHGSVEEEKEAGPGALQKSTLLIICEVSFYFFSILIFTSIIDMLSRIHFKFNNTNPKKIYVLYFLVANISAFLTNLKAN